MAKEKSDFDTTIDEDCSIDIYNLHIENKKNPALIEKWGRIEAEAKREKMEAERNLEEVFSTIQKEIRDDPGSYGLYDKPTETAIKGVINLDERYIAANKDFINKSHERNLAKKDFNAIYDKRLSIDGEIRLFLSGYYSDSNIPKDEIVNSVVEGGKVDVKGKSLKLRRDMMRERKKMLGEDE